MFLTFIECLMLSDEANAKIRLLQTEREVTQKAALPDICTNIRSKKICSLASTLASNSPKNVL